MIGWAVPVHDDGRGALLECVDHGGESVGAPVHLVLPEPYGRACGPADRGLPAFGGSGESRGGAGSGLGAKVPDDAAGRLVPGT